MRIVQYPITLRHGYCLFNCPSATDSESYGDPFYPGIRIRIVNYSGEKDILDRFDFTTNDGSPDFEEHWLETLHGEKTPWKIVRVVITNDHIYLQFASEQYFCKESADYMHLDTTSLRATLQFEVPHLHDPGSDMIEVELQEHNGITVTEIDGNKRRNFAIHSPMKKGDLGNFYAVVTEYM